MDFFKRPVKEIAVIKLLWLFDSNSQWMSVLIGLHHLYTSRCNTLPLILLVKLIPNKPAASNEKKKEATLCVLFYCSLAFGASVSHIEACTLMGFFSHFFCAELS